MSGLTESEAAALAARHVAAFNAAVSARNYSEFLTLFTDDAVIRFENVPGAGQLEFAGREAYTKAYDEQGPDDKIDITATVALDDGGYGVVVPIAWRRDGSPGTMGLTYSDSSSDDPDNRLVTAMTVVFG
jgi:SnoaL-like protein